MRRFRYGVDQMLKIIMLAAGGFLILALADKYEKEMGDGQEAAIIWEEYGKEMVAECIVTCEDTQATVDDILVYLDKEYEIKAIIPTDSHKKILLHRVGGLDV